MDYGAYGDESPAKLREMVRAYPGIRRDIPFWDDEFNSIPSWPGSDESVQAKYIPRGMVYNWARGVRTFVWLLTAATDGNEYDDFGMIHGLRHLPDDFTPRPGVLRAAEYQRAVCGYALRSRPSRSRRRMSRRCTTIRSHSWRMVFAARTGKPIVAYWLAAHSVPRRRVPARARGPDHREQRHPASGV